MPELEITIKISEETSKLLRELICAIGSVNSLPGQSKPEIRDTKAKPKEATESSEPSDPATIRKEVCDIVRTNINDPAKVSRIKEMLKNRDAEKVSALTDEQLPGFLTELKALTAD